MACFWKKPSSYYGLVFVVALALAIIYTWPAVTNPGRIIPGSFETDQNQNIWSLWWLKRALWDLHTNPYFTNHLFYPYGSDLYLYALEPFNGLLALPITLLFGPVVSFNFICLLGLALTGVTATALCYNASGSRVGAMVGGYAITFGLIHFSFVALGQLEFIGLWPFLLYLTFLVKLTRVRPAPDPKIEGLAQAFKPEGWYIAAASLSLLVASFTTLYYAAYAVIFTGLLFGFRIIQVRRLNWLGASLARLGLAWLVFGAIFGLFALRVSAEAKDINNLLKTPDQVILNESVAVHRYFSEFDGNSLLGQWLGLPRLAALNYTSYLGFSLVLLALAGLVLGKGTSQRPWPWLLTGLACAALSFGPALRLDAAPDPPLVPAQPFMPWNWLKALPFVSLTNTPRRFALLLLICMAVLASFGIAQLLRLWRERQGRVGYLSLGLSIILLIGLVLESPALPGLTRPVEVPPEVRVAEEDCTRQNCGNSVVLDLPFSKDHYISDANLMLWGALRERPIMGGYLSRRIADPYDPPYSAFRLFRLLAPTGDIFEPGADQSGRQILNFYHIRYLTVNQREYQRIYSKEPPVLSHFLEGMLGQNARIYAQDKLEVYRVPELRPEEKQPFVIVGPGWREVEADKPPKRWIGSAASLSIFSFDDRTTDLTMEGVAFASLRHMSVRLNDQPLPNLEISNLGWQALKITGLKLKKGQNTLYFNPLEAAQSPTDFDPTSKDTRNLSIALRQVKLN